MELRSNCESFTISRVTEIADSDTALFKNEVEDAFQDAIGATSCITDNIAMPKLTAKDVKLPDHFFLMRQKACLPPLLPWRLL